MVDVSPGTLLGRLEPRALYRLLSCSCLFQLPLVYAVSACVLRKLECCGVYLVEQVTGAWHAAPFLSSDLACFLLL